VGYYTSLDRKGGKPPNLLNTWLNIGLRTKVAWVVSGLLSSVRKKTGYERAHGAIWRVLGRDLEVSGKPTAPKDSLAETGEQQQFPGCRIKRLDQVFLW
jgi:hypothetical protein